MTCPTTAARPGPFSGAAPALEKEVAELLAEEGWRAESHEADAATWGADE